MDHPIIEQFNHIKSNRYNYEAEWQEISDLLDPESRAFTTNNSNGFVSRAEIYDSTPERAVDDLAGSLMSMTATPEKEWGTLTVEDPNQEIGWKQKTALQVATKQCLAHLARPKTNFYKCLGDVLYDFAIYGQGYTYMYPCTRTKVVKFANIPVQECYAQRDAYGKITAWYREFSMTPLELFNEFDNSKQNELRPDQKTIIKQEIKTNPTKQRMVMQAIISKIAAKALGIEVTNKDWVQLFVDLETRTLLHIDYLKRFPILAPSWTRKAKSPYGRGPGHKALPEIRVLNKMIITNLTAGQGMVQPAMLAPFEMFQDGELDLSPGANNWYSISDAAIASGIIKPEPLHLIKDLPIALELENLRRQQIAQVFYADLLQEFKGAEMSATETSIRKMSRVGKLSAPLATIQAEYLAPAFEFLFNSLVDFKIINASEIKNTDITVSFRSGLFEAYAMGKLQNLQLATQAVANLKGVPPQIAPSFKEDSLMEYVFTHAGADLSVLEEPETAQEKRERQQELEQSQVLANEAQATKQISEAFAEGIA